MNLKLLQSRPQCRGSWGGLAGLESETQPGSTAKAALSLAHFCPHLSMAPVLGDCKDGGGIVLDKDKGPTPMERLCEFRRPGRAKLNSTRIRLA